MVAVRRARARGRDARSARGDRLSRTHAFARAAAFVTLASCAPHAPATAPESAASRSPAPVATPSPLLPIRINTKRVGSKYVVLTKQNGNRKVYTLRADSESGQFLGGDTGRSDFVNPHVTFYARDGKRLVADAPAGTVVERDKTITMSGGVRARTGDGKTLASDRLRYDDGTETIFGDGDVVVTTPAGERLEGDRMRWNLRDGKLDVAGAR